MICLVSISTSTSPSETLRRTSSRIHPMHSGKLVFEQLKSHLPLSTFRRCVASYGGEHKVKNFSCLEEFLCLAFAQLTVSVAESLRVSNNPTVGDPDRPDTQRPNKAIPRLQGVRIEQGRDRECTTARLPALEMRAARSVQDSFAFRDSARTIRAPVRAASEATFTVPLAPSTLFAIGIRYLEASPNLLGPWSPGCSHQIQTCTVTGNYAAFWFSTGSCADRSAADYRRTGSSSAAA